MQGGGSSSNLDFFEEKVEIIHRYFHCLALSCRAYMCSRVCVHVCVIGSMRRK